MPTLKLFAFGPPRLVRGSEPLDISLRKDMALLVYLAVTRQPHSRDALATLLWPDSDQQAGRSNLRRALYRLNTRLQSDALVATAKTVEVDPDAGLWVDVEVYDAHVAACLPGDSAAPVSEECLSRLTEAAELYTDDFLAGFTLPDSPAFDEWQFFQTEGLRQSLGEVLDCLVRSHQRHGEFDQAIAHARRRLTLDPLYEPAHRDLMRLYAWTDQQAAAMRQYEECVRIFDEEFGVPPEDETVALYESIRTRQVEPPEVLLTEPAPLPARELALYERYVAEELLATGGQGEVYRGTDRVTGEPVVIKRLRPELLTDSSHHVTRFVREGETLRRLNHPNIVRMLASFDVEGQYSIVMEYVPGGTLRDLLAEAAQLPVERVLDIALELADALSRAHHLGIFHRDLKPGNVLMAGDGTPRLTDFGLARLEHEDTHLTQTGSTIGSPAYMSPEALRGQRFDARSDVWSFGVVLYEMLAGRRPFEGEQITPILVSILEDPVPAITQFRSDVPPALVDLLRRVLTKDPEQRIASMRLVAADLEAIRDGHTNVESRTLPAAVAIQRQTQQIRFCTSFDGVNIAYAITGNGSPLVKAANWLSHLEFDWNSPVWRHWLTALSEHHTLIRYDKRGCGLSDWNAEDFSLNAQVQDLEHVVRAAGLTRFPLLGISGGGPVAIAFTVRHPDMVSHLILYGTYARGRFKRLAGEQRSEEAAVLLGLMKIGWGQENPAFRKVYTSLFMPEATPDQMDWFDELQRISTSPELAVKMSSASYSVDVKDLAGQVAVSTLVLHAREDAVTPFEEGRHLAALIPDARFVPLTGKNHILLEHEPAWTQFRTELRRFLDTDSPTSAPSPSPVHRSPQPAQTNQDASVVESSPPAVEIAPNGLLPAQPTPFIGRETELAEVGRLLLETPDCRLLTLVGPGGIGKTRLSLAAASAAQPAFRDGVYFVSLAPVTEPAHIIPTIADALGFTFRGSNEPRTQLFEYLRTRHLLLVLDNVEQLLDEAEFVSSLLAAAPDVSLLVTSRERLNLQEEWTYDVRGLPFPRAGDETRPAEQYSAVRLFVERARHASTGFSPSGDDVEQIVRICRLVDGMPLALELAAPWVRVMSCEAIADELAHSLDLLTTTMRNVPARHRSVRAVFEQSWARLSEEEQDVLCGLSVFRGGCTREAAFEVAGATLPLLAALMDRALLRRDRHGRYQMHEVVRQFALEQAQQDDAGYKRLQDRHCTYYANLLAEQTAGLKGGRQKEAFAEIRADIDNVRAAWRYAVSHRYAEAIEKAAESLWLYGEFRGTLHQSEAAFRQAAAQFSAGSDSQPRDEHQALVGFLRAAEGYMRARRGEIDSGRRLMEDGLSQLRQSATIDTYKEATLLQQLGYVLLLHGRFEDAKRRGETALALFTTLGDRPGVANSLLIIGASLHFQGHFQEADAVLSDCLVLCKDIGTYYVRVHVDQLLARTAIAQGKYGRARELLDDALTLIQKFSGLWLVAAYTAREYGWLDAIEGEYAQAEERLRESVVLFQESGSQWEAGDSLGYLGTAVRLQGRLDEAEALYAESLAAAESVGHQMNQANALANLGCLAYDRGDYEAAWRRLREAEALWQTIGNEPELASVLRHLGHVAVVQQEGSEQTAREYYVESLRLAIHHHLAPVALDIFVAAAGLYATAGEMKRAVELLTLVAQHAGGTHETREQARTHLAALATELPAESARDDSLVWRETAAELMEMFSDSDSE